MDWGTALMAIEILGALVVLAVLGRWLRSKAQASIGLRLTMLRTASERFSRIGPATALSSSC